MVPPGGGRRDELLTVPFQGHLAALGIASTRLLVAVSGGPDSLALLDLLAGSRVALGLDLVVAHVDHGIHPESCAVAERVRHVASDYGLEFLKRRLRLGPEASETAARTARHRALELMRRRAHADLIVTAHHADDQAETVLMRALRGSGPAGLTGMAVRSGRILHPLLPFSREQLARHLRASGRTGWLDPANSDRKHLRSWIRHDILPALRVRLPEIDAHLGRLADQATVNRAGWDALLEALPDIDYRAEPRGGSVASKALEAMDRNLLICIAMALARRCGFSLGIARAARLLELLHLTASGSRVPLGGDWIAELSFGRIHFTRLPTDRAPVPRPLALARGTARWDGWRFNCVRDTAPERQPRVGMTAWFEQGALLVRSWREGERVRPLGGRSRLLVRCFQDARIPRSRRIGWPALESAGSLVWVPGVCRSDLLVPPPGVEALRVDARFA